jgi:hypothetical protein
VPEHFSRRCGVEVSSFSRFAGLAVASWSLIFALWAWRVWGGGPAGPWRGSCPTCCPGLAWGAALLTAGVLLRRREISRWSGF